MKTNFLPRSKRRHASHGRVIVTVTLVFVCGALLLTYFGNTISSLLKPLWQSDTLLHRGVANAALSMRSKDELISENVELKEQLASYEELVISFRAIASSRDELLASFGRETVEGIPAAVLVRPPETPYDIFIIDAGDNLGIRPTSLVTTPQGVAIGTVTAVFSTTAHVKLYSTAGERTDAVLERGGESITLIGRGAGNLEFIVPRDTKVELGDRVVLPYLDAPLVAVVGDIEMNPTSSFKTVIAQNPANPSKQRFVLIHQ